MLKNASLVSKLIGGTVGVAILVLAAPRLMAEMIMMPVQPTLEQLKQGDAVDDKVLMKAYEALLQSETWVRTGDGLLKRAWLEHELAKRSGDQAEQVAWLEKSERSTEQSVLMAPGNPHAWMRLAYLRYRLSGAESGAKEALLLSLRTGPYEQVLTLRQIRYAIEMWSEFSEAEREEVRGTIIWADTIMHADLVKLAQTHPNAQKVIISALAKDLDQLKKFIGSLFNR